MIKELNLNTVLTKMMNQLDKKIDSFLQARTNRGEKAKRNDFFQEVKKGKIIFPVSRDTYYNYNRTLNNKSKYNAQAVYLSDFYKICQYTEISADYYLGFIETKRKEESAPQVRKDFGLTDESMFNLSQIKKNKVKYKGEVSADLVNYILENQDFWLDLNDTLPSYISCLDYRVDGTNQDAARYVVMKVFERLLDNIAQRCVASDFPNANINEAAPFSF